MALMNSLHLLCLRPQSYTELSGEREKESEAIK